MIAQSRTLYASLSSQLMRLEPLALLALRLLVARVFWNSGLGKVHTVDVAGLRLPTPSIEQATYQLFAYEFFDGAPAWFTDAAAVAATIGELTLPILVACGVLARLGAAGLLAMTAVIQIFVYPGEWWSVHAWWAVCLFAVLVRGPGALSIDRLIGFDAKRP